MALRSGIEAPESVIVHVILSSANKVKAPAPNSMERALFSVSCQKAERSDFKLEFHTPNTVRYTIAKPEDASL
jgi:hypothetical protein